MAETGPRTQSQGLQQQDDKSKKDLLEGNQVWVSSTKRLSFYVDIAIRMFVKHEQIELHGLGAAIASAVEVSQLLLKTNKCLIKKIVTSTVSTGPSRKPEIVIHLQRTQIPQVDEPTTADEDALVAITEDD